MDPPPVYVSQANQQNKNIRSPSYKQQSKPFFEGRDDLDGQTRDRPGDNKAVDYKRENPDSNHSPRLDEVKPHGIQPTAQAAQPAKSPQRRRWKEDGNARLPQPAIFTSPNTSQEFGIGELSLDSRKRSPPRKAESLRHHDQDYRRSSQKRARIAPTSERQTSGRSPPLKPRKPSPRGKRTREKPSKSPPRQTQPLEILPSPSPSGEPPPETPPPNKAERKGDKAVDPPSNSQPRIAETKDPTAPREAKHPTDPKYPGIFLQPESRPISPEQLAAEVKSIYSGLSMVEAKCITVDAGQSTAIQNGDHWQALIALHRTLLHEHHDFFLASQHPSASQALRRLASKYSMPARMWKHGIHSFLELLRCRLPHSREYMRTFIYFAYHMMALLYETVPSFEDTWIECLGDLGRYRMAIEDDDPRERDNWAGISQYWYRMAADRAPGVGRLYHHLAILARSEQFQQIYYYCRSFTCVQLFPSARESVLAVFEPIFNRKNTSTPIPRIDTFYTKLHGMIFLKKQLEDFKAVTSNFLELLDNYIHRAGIKWREHGAWLAISNIGALFDHGSQMGVLRQQFEFLAASKGEGAESDSMDSESVSSRGPPTPSSSADMAMADADALSRTAFYHALDMTVFTLKLVLRRTNDRNVLPHIHIMLAFLIVLADIKIFSAPAQEEYVNAILDKVPWKDLSTFATNLAGSKEFGLRYETTSFLLPEHGDIGILPEDYLLKGQLYTQTLYPDGWWRDGEIDPEEKSIEHASTVRKRGERILNYMYRLAKREKWISYDDKTKSWAAISRTSEQRSSPEPLPIVEMGRNQAPRLSIETFGDAEMEIDEPDERESDDSPMDDAASQISENDSREMLYVKEQERLIRASEGLQASQGDNLQIPPSGSRNTRSAGMDLMHKGYTIMVCASDILLHHQDVFKMISKGGFPIVIPSNVIAELFHHSQKESLKLENPEAASARAAIETIKAALDQQKDIRILTTEGEDVTGRALSDDIPAFFEQNDQQDTDDIVIGVARRASDLSSNQQAQPNGKAKPAILVTEYKSTRLKAGNRDIPTMSTSRVKTILQTILGRRRSSSAGSSNCRSGLVTPTEIAG